MSLTQFPNRHTKANCESMIRQSVPSGTIAFGMPFIFLNIKPWNFHFSTKVRTQHNFEYFLLEPSQKGGWVFKRVIGSFWSDLSWFRPQTWQPLKGVFNWFKKLTPNISLHSLVMLCLSVYQIIRSKWFANVPSASLQVYSVNLWPVRVAYLWSFKSTLLAGVRFTTVRLV